MIRYQCPTCGTDLQSEDSAAGLKQVCPVCRAVCQVPADGGQQAPAPPGRQAPGRSDPLGQLAAAASGRGGDLVTCRDCGQPVSPRAAACPHCGAPVSAPVRHHVPRHVPSHLAGAILVTLFCCVPFGIVGIVYAAQVGSRLAARDYAGAQHASKTASTWNTIALLTGLLGGVGWLLLTVILPELSG